MKVGDIFTLNENKRDIHFTKIGLLKVEILEIELIGTLQFATVKVLATGTITKIIL